MPEAATLAILAPVVFVATFVFQILGFGAGLIAVPLASLFFELPFVIAVFSILELFNGIRLVTASGRQLVWHEAWPLITLSLLGTIVGISLLIYLSSAWLMLGVAIFIAVFLLQTRFKGSRQQPIARLWAVPAGFISGLCSAMFGMGGPPYLIYLHLRVLSSVRLRATVAGVGVTNLVWRVTSFTVAGLYWQTHVLSSALLLIPIAGLAMFVAEKARPWINDQQLRSATYLLLGAAAAILGWRAIKQLIA